MSNFLTYIERQPPWLVFTICIATTALIGLLDFITGDLSIVLFYVIPIFLAVWTLRRSSGLFIALLCGAELFAIDRFLAPFEVHLFSIRTWNALMEAFLLFFTGYLLAALKKESGQKKKKAEDLEASNMELDAFNYSVAHDLRKPLTNINGYSQLIMEMYGGKMDSQCREYLNEIYEGTLRMNQLIDALLDFSRLAHSELHLENISLSAMASSITAELRLAEPARMVEIQIVEGITSTGDPKLVRVVLENLLGNAWKYTAGKADTVISFGVKESGVIPIYFVRDNGVGFDSSQVDKIFLPFHRLHTTDEFAGFGIGLATVQRIIQRHGGRIWAEGEPDKGATFYFTLGCEELHRLFSSC